MRSIPHPVPTPAPSAGAGPARRRPRGPAAALVLAAFVAAALAPAGPAVAQTGGAAAARVQSLEAEIRRLNGRIEALEFRLDRIAQDAARRLNDLDYRLTLEEGGDPALVGDPVPLGGAAAQAAAPSGESGSSDASSAAAAVAVSERDAFDAAKAALEDGRPEAARDGFRRFLQDYGDGPLAPLARHWLGMAQWRTGDARAAAQTFLAHVTDAGDGQRAAESMLMLGRALEALGRVGQACLTLAEVPARHPGTDAAAEAEQVRAGLSCGG